MESHHLFTAGLLCAGEGKQITVMLGVTGQTKNTFLIQGSGSLSLHPIVECL